MRLREGKEIFVSYLKNKGLRYTPQREEILNAFLSANKHFTVDDLYYTLKKKSPHIGYATIHRNLKLLFECGLADGIKIGIQKTRYEQKYGHRHHDHLICINCEKLIEVNDEKIEELQDKLAREKNFQPIRHKLEIYGLCSKCR